MSKEYGVHALEGVKRGGRGDSFEKPFSGEKQKKDQKDVVGKR